MVIRGAAGLYFDSPDVNGFLSQAASNGGAIGLQGNPAGAAPVFRLGIAPQQVVAGQLLAPLATTPAATCVVTVPTLSNPAGNVNPCGLFTVNQNLKNASTVNFNLDIQQQLSSGVIFELAYVGAQGRHQELVRDINQAGLSTQPSSAVDYAYNLQARRPLYSQYPTYAAINSLDSVGNANYNALQVTIRTQGWHNLSSMFSYENKLNHGVMRCRRTATTSTETMAIVISTSQTSSQLMPITMFPSSTTLPTGLLAVGNCTVSSPYAVARRSRFKAAATSPERAKEPSGPFR